MSKETVTVNPGPLSKKGALRLLLSMDDAWSNGEPILDWLLCSFLSGDVPVTTAGGVYRLAPNEEVEGYHLQEIA